MSTTLEEVSKKSASVHKEKSFVEKYLTARIATPYQFSGKEDKEVLFSTIKNFSERLQDSRYVSFPFHGKMDILTGRVAYASDADEKKYVIEKCNDIEKDFFKQLQERLGKENTVILKDKVVERSIDSGKFYNTMKAVFEDGNFKEAIAEEVRTSRIYNTNISGLTKDVMKSIEQDAEEVFSRAIKSIGQKYNITQLADKAKVTAFTNEIRELGNKYRKEEKGENTEVRIGAYGQEMGGSFRELLMYKVAGNIDRSLRDNASIDRDFCKNVFKETLKDFASSFHYQSTNKRELETNSERHLKDMRREVLGIFDQHIDQAKQAQKAGTEVNTR